MRQILTFTLLFFLTSIYAQMSDLELVKLKNDLFFSPTYLDQRRVALLNYVSYSNKKDSIVYEYPDEMHKVPSLRLTYTWENGTYVYSNVDSIQLNGDNSEMVTLKNYKWDLVSDSFILNSRSMRTYYSNIDSVVFQIPSNGTWVNNRLSISQQYPSGKLKRLAFYNWVAAESKWDFSLVIRFTELGSVKEYKSININGGGKEVYEWDALDRPISRKSYNYNLETKAFENLDSYIYHWIDTKTQIGMHSKWVADHWVYKQKEVLNYGENGLVKEKLVLDSIAPNQYENNLRTIYDYKNGQKVYVKNFRWNSEWVNYSLRVSTYNGFDNLVTSKLSYWANETNKWVLNSINHNYYETFENGLVSIQALNKVAIKLYPNPATEFITLELEHEDSKFHITIYSLTGRSVLSQKGSSGTNIDISRLADGQYFYILKGDGFGASGSFLKK